MQEQTIKAWALKRPTGEVMLTFIRSTKAEVLASVSEHFPQHEDFKHRWRTMKRQGFDVVRLEVMLNSQKCTYVDRT